MSVSTEWLEQVPVLKQGLAFRVIDDECIVVDPISSRSVTLNSVGSRVWHLIDEGYTGRRIVETLCEEHDVEPAVAERDVEAFLQDLANRGLLETNANG